MVKEVLRAPKDRPLRVLLLGLGCGAIAAGIVHGLIEGHTLTAIDAIDMTHLPRAKKKGKWASLSEVGDGSASTCPKQR